MTQITISNGVTTITMPRTKKISVGGEELANEIVMAGGKMVKDIIGHRTVVSADWDYVPAAIIAALVTMLRAGGYFTVTYPDHDGSNKSGVFSVSYPQTKVFRFVDGVAVWHEVSLKMTAQEVV